jgi:hypothetical protein
LLSISSAVVFSKSTRAALDEAVKIVVVAVVIIAVIVVAVAIVIVTCSWYGLATLCLRHRD